MTVSAKNQYPIAVTDPSTVDQQAVSRAVKWLMAHLPAVGGEVLIYTPGRRQMQATELTRYATMFKSETWLTLQRSSWRGGPVLAAWPTQEKLTAIALDRRTKALCVVPWQPSDVSAWATAFAAPNLSQSVQAPPQSIDDRIDPVVAEGLKTLTITVNHANQLAGSLDKRDAIAVLRTLHDGGYALDPDHIYTWALAHEWPARGAERLKNLAARIASGVRPPFKGPFPFRDNILQIWITKSAGN